MLYSVPAHPGQIAQVLPFEVVINIETQRSAADVRVPQEVLHALRVVRLFVQVGSDGVVSGRGR